MLSAAVWLMLSSMLTSLRISGGGSFPKPLTAEEERMYLQRSAAGDLEARNILIERNLRLVAHIMKNYAGGYKGTGSAADAPLGTVTAKDHNSLVTVHIMTMRNNMDGQPIDEPLSTVSCSGAHHAEVQAFLVKYFSNGAAKSVNEPLDTVTTKDRFALVTIHGEEYIITDIKMRMLQPRELFNAQGFPADYIIDHDADGHSYVKSKQVARCGNAVTPPVPAALVRANLPEASGGKREMQRKCMR